MIKRKRQSLLPFFMIMALLVMSVYFGTKSYTISQKKPVTTHAATIFQPVPIVKPQLNSALLTKYLITQAVLLGAVDHMSYYFKDLQTETAISQDPERSWIPASTIKAYVVLEAFRQKSLGLIDFNQTVTINKNNVVPTAMESNEFPKLDEGVQVTIKQLVETMIIQSDNTAFNSLLDILDRRNINNTLKNYNLTETVVGEKLSLDDNQLAIDLNVPGRQSNTTTAKDLAVFYDLLFNKKVSYADEILTIFKRQKFKDMIPAQIPQFTDVAHKTGEWDPYYHDGGIVYKENSPFIFIAFSNNGTPEVVAEEARVAYYQSAQSVGAGKQIAFNLQPKNTSEIKKEQPVYYLSEMSSPRNVLGEKTQKFPSLTAQDLGITSGDFGINPQFATIIKGALITKNSPFYGFKSLWENLKINLARNNSQKTKVYLDITHDRLSQIKSLLNQNDLKDAQDVLNETDTYLKKAANLTGTSANSETTYEIKELSDLRFSLIGAASTKIPPSEKQQFVDNVYNFYQQYKKGLNSDMQSQAITNPDEQKPMVATVASVNGQTATLKLSDGSIKQMLLLTTTPLRNFQSSSFQNATTITVGNQIAVVGTVTTNQQIIPQFVLNNVPRELPQPREGLVIKVDPNANELTILNPQGKEVVIKVNQNTLLKSKDTNVSLEGIKAGSQISVFGTQAPPSPPTLTPVIIVSPLLSVIPTHIVTSVNSTVSPPTSSPLSTNQPSISITITPPRLTSFPTIITTIPSKTTTAVINPTSGTKTTISKAPARATTALQVTVIKATSITVVNNGSGAKETTKPPSSTNNTKVSPTPIK